MSRKTARELALRLLYATDVTGYSSTSPFDEQLSAANFTTLKDEDELYKSVPSDDERLYIHKLLTGVRERQTELDLYIQQYAIGWQFGRISRISICILRISLFEILYMDDIPNASSINEAVEFAKNYDSPEAGSLVNGILGSFVRKELKN